MSAFGRALRERRSSATPARWLFVPYDQLTRGIGPLARARPADVGVVLVESAWKAARRPYHRQKLALVLANLRHFALELAEAGYAVRHVVAEGPYRSALAPLAEELGPLAVMRPAERELRADLAPLVASGAVEVLPHEGWLTTADQFARAAGDPPWRMDAFYRLVRKETGILMEAGAPVGGRFSFDAENREPWRGAPPAPEPPPAPADPIKEEVVRLVERRFPRHPGRARADGLAATAADAARLWRFALEECLPSFGPFEDAMSARSSGLFHTRISPLLNLHRLLPADVVRDAAACDAPLPSREGFVRQVLGWREFVRHVHEATDGFRRVAGRRTSTAAAPGDGGFARWSGGALEGAPEPAGLDGGARPSRLGARGAVPPAFWGARSGLACLDRVVADVWREGWSHHITRLMVLSNLATLLAVEPRALTDWFWVAYVDAYDWVVEPNVLGMGTFALGDLMTTKPYVSGSAYLRRMSDYCDGCSFDPRSTCPIGRLYWAFLARHRTELAGNPRLAMPLASLARRSAEEREEDRRTFERVRRSLARGEELRP